MKKWLLLVLCVLVATFMALGQSRAGDDEVIKGLVDGRAAVKPMAVPSSLLPDLTMEKAYALQQGLVKALLAKGEAVSGFKAGLTSAAGQKQFGVDQPVLAPLFKSGAFGPGAVVKQKDFVRLFTETEIGYVAGEKIDKPVKDVESLKKMISEVFPAVELPDIRFADMKSIKGVDLVAEAVGSAKFIVGKKIPADQVDVSQVQVKLTLNGEVVNQGKAADVMGDQWQALLWLINGAVARGWTIEPGYIFITGAMGRMLPGKPGKYEGDWGPLGTMSWSVEE
jgi:2-keto-4-pentenoate hydratase